MAYATAAEFAAARREPLPEGDGLQVLEDRLERASDRLDSLTLTAIYAVDAQGKPAAAAVASAFRSACIVQAAYMAVHGDELQQPEGPAKLGTLDLPATTGLEDRYAPEAIGILERAGLLSMAVQAPSPWGYL